jgi:hypothetical protein
MLNYDEIIDKSVRKSGTIIPDATLLGYTNKEPKNVSIYKNIMEDDLADTGKIKLSPGTHKLYKTMNALAKKADSDLQRGMERGLSGAELKRLKQGVSLQILKGIEEAKTARRDYLFNQIEEINKREKAGNGKSSTQELLDFQRAQLEASALPPEQVGALLQSYEKDPSVSVNRDKVLYFMSHAEGADKKKAIEIFNALPDGLGMSASLKGILSELENINSAPVGTIPLIKEDGGQLGSINGIDMLAGNTAPPTAEDILKS